jgi:hypothetical protein
MSRGSLCLSSVIVVVAAGLVTAAVRAVPTRVSIDIVPSEFDEFITPRGNVRVTFRDKHTEVWAHGGDCRDPHISPKGDIGWVRAERISLDRANMRFSGSDFLNLRLLSGRVRELSPLADVPDARFIEQWRFADAGDTVVARLRSYHGPAFYLKYDVQTGSVIDDVGAYRTFSRLPAWAKPIADESSKE